MSITLRRATRADLPALARLAVQLVHQHHAFAAQRFALFQRLEEGYAWFLGRELDDADAVVLAAARDDGTIVGYAYGRVEDRSYEALLEALEEREALRVEGVVLVHELHGEAGERGEIRARGAAKGDRHVSV